jgi:ferredoxin-thioredoxin reductase catalytic chain
MIMETEVSQEEIEKSYEALKKDTAAGGYYLNPDSGFTKELVKGLLVNEKRYGYPNCPCRLASGDRSEDVDIICPCDYRDADISEYGSCY